LMPTVVALLVKRRELQDQERATAPSWATVTYQGEPISLVFTTPTGGLVLRQAVAKVVKEAAKTAGIAADLATHAGRRTVVTTLFMDGDEALEGTLPVRRPRQAGHHGGLREAAGSASGGRGEAGCDCARRPGRRGSWGSESGERFWEQRWSYRTEAVGSPADGDEP